MVGLAIPHSLRRSAWAIRAAPALVGGFSLLAVLVYVADEHPALKAGAGTLQTGVVSLYGVVVILSGWVRVGCARLLCGHEVPPRGPGSGVLLHLRGHFFIRRRHSSAFIDLCQSFY
jgi:hypothetical protein